MFVTRTFLFLVPEPTTAVTSSASASTKGPYSEANSGGRSRGHYIYMTAEGGTSSITFQSYHVLFTAMATTYVTSMR